MHQKQTDIIIIGGGLAGLCCAIHLGKNGIHTTVIEKSVYPRHKVCGEYLSAEILPYLTFLGVNFTDDALPIRRFRFTGITGNHKEAELPLGGYGISRYRLDHMLYETALAYGCRFIFETVKQVDFKNEKFTIKTDTETYTADFVLGAYGKRSGIDQYLSRTFIRKKSPWLAVKAHYKGDFPSDMVGLYHFPGGYCGVSNIENNTINICYLADYSTFKQYKNIKEYQEYVLGKNPLLGKVLKESDMIFNAPLTISQISFEAKKPVVNHILMIGDTAGLIHPLCGNGMAMAIHSAKIAAELITDYINEDLTRTTMEKKYAKQWKSHFGKRIKTGRFLALSLQNKYITRFLFSLINVFPGLLSHIIRKTHGKPIFVKV